MIDAKTIERAAELLQAAAPAATVILFGSYARGEPREDSDLDFLVIEPELKARRKEMVRLRDVLRPLRVPVDVVVASRKAYDEWSDTPGTLLYKARQEGRIVGSTP
jgi:predicted nucleotidyltransferase